ncbi:DNA translocase FtsK [Pseudomonas gingeri]|uniref:DNA translocase FtsK n=1 Tax=Pseudomonas gingeri TaxID=117681 RepID=UPI0015A09C9C|nr:DNA translocase FtsK [Pseudomonas gingeri]NVZ61227.1 DNA translocase FtsK [Pseudomonas gingeri]NVZ73779.1 DNA translocase FtsK [Pseudomonas gingeri]
MKIEHLDAIENAKLHGVMPSVLAHELLVRDLVEAAMFELKNIAAPFSKLNEGQQQEVIDRITEKAENAVMTAVCIISSRIVDTIPLIVADAKFKAKSITVTGVIDAQDPNRHGLIDVAGKLCLLVLAPNDYNEALDSIRPERDQRDLPLHSSDITRGLFDGKPAGPDEPDGQPVQLGTQEELDALVNVGKPNAQVADGKEFGDFTYEDAKQLIVLKAKAKAFKGHWVQSRLAIDSDRAATLLLRLLDDKVLEIETEGESAFDHSFKVIAKLEDVI